jgi:hypothetical protein
MLGNDTTQPGTNILPLSHPDPMSQVGIDLQRKPAVLHANYISQELNSVGGGCDKRYYLIGRAVPEEDGYFFSMV